MANCLISSIEAANYFYYISQYLFHFRICISYINIMRANFCSERFFLMAPLICLFFFFFFSHRKQDPEGSFNIWLFHSSTGSILRFAVSLSNGGSMELTEVE